MLQPGGRASGSVGGGSKLSGWGDNVEERDSAMEFVSGGWDGGGVCNELCWRLTEGGSSSEEAAT